MRFAILALIGAAMVTGPAAGSGPRGKGVDEWAGTCGADSYSVDEHRRRTPFSCNALLHTVTRNGTGREYLIFTTKDGKGKITGRTISLKGVFDGEGNFRVFVFLTGREVAGTSRSVCANVREGAVFKRIQCNATSSLPNNLSSVMIDFTATGKIEARR